MDRVDSAVVVRRRPGSTKRRTKRTLDFRNVRAVAEFRRRLGSVRKPCAAVRIERAVLTKRLARIIRRSDNSRARRVEAVHAKIWRTQHNSTQNVLCKARGTVSERITLRFNKRPIAGRWTSHGRSETASEPTKTGWRERKLAFVTQRCRFSHVKKKKNERVDY